MRGKIPAKFDFEGIFSGLAGYGPMGCCGPRFWGEKWELFWGKLVGDPRRAGEHGRGMKWGIKEVKGARGGVCS